MIINHAPRPNTKSWVDRRTIQDRARNTARDLTSVEPCNDNQLALSTVSFRRTRRPVLFCRWRMVAGGALECVWRTDIEAASAGEEPQICRWDESLWRPTGVTAFRQGSTWPENYTAPSFNLGALTVYARPFSIRLVQVRRFV